MESPCKIAELGLISMLHDMNNPLTNIRLCLELLEDGSPELKEKYYLIIKSSADKMESSIKDICSCFVSEEFTVHVSNHHVA